MTAREALALERVRVMDYAALTKPELTLLSVLTALAGYFVASPDGMSGARLASLAAGTALVGGGSGAINQYLERKFDALMHRTEHRPLPAGRIAPREALQFGICLIAAGLTVLAVGTNALTSSLAAVTVVTYLLLYTPLKRLTPAATLIGGIPGGLPPVMGWSAARGDIAPGAWILFGILFFWQMPHFLSLAWMYRKDYLRAGYRLIAAGDHDGRQTARHALAHASALLPVSLLLCAEGSEGMVYGVAAAALGTAFIACALAFRDGRSPSAARRLFAASLLYLPALMLAMVADRLLR